MRQLRFLPSGSIGGSVYEDLNGDGIEDGNDSQGDGRLSFLPTMLLDLNDNGKVDPGEPTTTAGLDFFFSDVLPGTYTLRLITAPGNDGKPQTVTVKAGHESDGFLFGWIPPR